MWRSFGHDSCYRVGMKVATAQVIDGMVEVPAEIADGSQVAILALDDGMPFELTPREQQKLSDALAEIHAGRYADGLALLDDLKAKSRA